MSDLEDFQRDHGAEWAQITQSPAFGAAMQFLNLAKIASIAALSPEDIEAKGKLVLADLVGHLRHENDLMILSARKEFKFGAPVEETYPDAAEEAVEAHAQESGNGRPATSVLKPRKKRK